MKRVIMMVMLAIISTVMVGQSIDSIGVNMPKDSILDMNQDAVFAEFYINVAVDSEGIIDTSAQAIYIYCKKVRYNSAGAKVPSLTEKVRIDINQGSDEFKAWFAMFDDNFKEAIRQELLKLE